MKTLAALTLSLFLISGTALADSSKDAGPQPAKSRSPGKAKATKVEKTDANFAAELEELRQTLEAQQEQLQMLKEELGKRDRQIDEAREAAAAANARAAEATSKATEAVNASSEVRTSEASLTSTVGDLKTSNELLKTTVATEQAEAKKSSDEGPATIHYKGISITPGGFIAAETISRSRAESADINTSFTNIPYPGNSLAHVSENNFTARQSRATLLAESAIGDVKLTGYYEGDFLGAGTTSNNRQTNSYVFRQRQIWGQVGVAGFTFTGGQMWTLATEDRKGIQNRQELLPMMIDPNYVVGFTWARQYGFRIVKDFGGKFALGFSVEGPQATIGGRGFDTLTSTTAAGVATTSQNFFSNAPGQSGGLYNAFDPTGYTVNKSPDFVFKAAADPGWGHYELFGIVSAFRNRIFPCGVVGTTAENLPKPVTPTVVPCAVDGTTAPSAAGAFNDTRTGGGFGASLNVPLFAKKVDFGLKAVAGDGIGRYGSAQLSDLTARPDGTQALIRTTHGLARLEFHATPKLDIYLYGGSEYAWRAAYQGYTTIAITNTPAIPATATSLAIPATSATSIKLNQIGGYGSPNANNSQCSLEKAPTSQLIPSTGGTCAGDIRVITEGTIGFWHKIYQGPKGGFRWGIQYSYITKSGWSGNNSVPPAAPGVSVSPKAVDNAVWTSFRYYIP
jgi:TolA-binding protein